MDAAQQRIWTFYEAIKLEDTIYNDNTLYFSLTNMVQTGTIGLIFQITRS